MLYGWGKIAPSFIGIAMRYLREDLEAASRGELDMEYIGRLAGSILASQFLNYFCLRCVKAYIWGSDM